MKILILRTFPDIISTTSYNVQEIGLAKALILAGHICDIVFYHGNKQDVIQEMTFYRDGNRYSLKIYWFKGFNFIKNGYMPSVKNIVQQYDVIQVNEYDQLYSWWLYTHQKRPTVIYHGLYYHPYTKGYNFKCKIFDKLFLPLWDVTNIVSLTKSEMASDFLKKKGFKRIYTAGVGIDEDNFVEIGNQEVICPVSEKKSGIFRLLYIGKIEDRRNSLFLLDVFMEVLKAEENVELVVIGSGEKEYTDLFFKAADELMKSGKLQYIDKITQKEIQFVYKEADLFIFPSNYEIFGMVLLEAMYFGVPVASSYNGGASVLIDNGKNGLIVDDFCPEHWAEVILALMKQPDLYQDMKKKASQSIKENFLWARLSQIFINAYKEAIYIFEENESGKNDRK